MAEVREEIAGYINLYWKTLDGPTEYRYLPEIVDFGVLIKFRRQGIGSKLMDVAEVLASSRAYAVGLGVGLHYGYGSGAWYQGHVLEQYAPCCNDDDLVQYLYKKLR